jgi:hypothetical protein
MKQSVIYPVIVLAALILICGMSGAIPPTLEGKFHKDKDLKILVIDSRHLKDIEKIKKNPAGTKILVIQTKPEELKKSAVETIMEWVRGGGTVWFYDSRMAPYFGMESSPLRKTDELKYKPEKGEFGIFKNTKGAACTAFAVGKHPVNTGVEGVTVFLIEIDKDTYSAVKESEGVVALLKVVNEPIAVAAIRREDKGLVVFKPLLWPESLTGDRFQANLKEYSAGFPVPGAEHTQEVEKTATPGETATAAPAATPSPTATPSPGAAPSPTVTPSPSAAPSPTATPSPSAAPSPTATPSPAKTPGGKKKKGQGTVKYDLVVLRDRQEIKGKVLNEFFRLDMVNNIPSREIRKIEFGDSATLDTVILKNGMRLQGYLPATDTVDIALPGKKQMSLPKASVREIIFEAHKDGGNPR